MRPPAQPWTAATVHAGGPRPVLRVRDVMGLVPGTVIGAGIFRTPSLVASNAGGEGAFLFAWGLGGALSLVGALCYAELATACPDAGGDYHFLRRAFGTRLAFLFAWARLTVIQTGSIALLAFLVGDYAARLATGPSSTLYAALGGWTRKGFETMVDYTAPVFWLFLLLTGVSLFVLRRTAPAAEAFRVPLYPLTPLVFCGTSGCLLYASLAYTEIGAFIGMGVLGAGGLVLAGLSLGREARLSTAD